MPRLVSRIFMAFLMVLSAAPGCAAAPTAPATRSPRNLFTEVLGKPELQVRDKLQAAWKQLFHGSDADERVYFPVGKDQAYIADIGSNDVRSEGMSYGMMIAVMMDKPDEFGRLWNWTKAHMLHRSGPRRGYFAWHCTFDGKQLDPGSASDGEEWFAMALLFAAHRWGGTVYADDAQAVLDAMLIPRTGNITALFDRRHKQVVFAPTAAASAFTDPSYHLPHFYELWARWDRNTESREFWKAAAAESRGFFKRAAHPRTGLMPEYAEFDGRPRPGEKGDFRYDAWRILSNVAMDYAWFEADSWQIEQSNRVLRFLNTRLSEEGDIFTLDGKPLSQDNSIGLTAMAAVAGHASDPKLARPFIEQLWAAEIPRGKWRYYNGLLYTLALLQVSGEFRIHDPAAN